MIQETAMASRRVIIGLVSIAFLVSGCATPSANIPTAYVSPMQYHGYDCMQIAAEMSRLSMRASQLAGQLDTAATNDAALTAVGLFLFWPAFFFVGGNKQQEADYGRLKGEYEALQQQAVMRRCPGAIAPSTIALTQPAGAPSSGLPPGPISPGLYYEPAYPGAPPTLARAQPAQEPGAFPGPGPQWDLAYRDYGMPVEPVWTISGPAARAGFAPAVGADVGRESLYLVTAERIAKAEGCLPPAAVMTAKGAGQESFIIACPDGTTLAMQCGAEGCRILR